MCVYLVEKLRVNVNARDNKGALFGLLLWFRKLQNTSVPTNINWCLTSGTISRMKLTAPMLYF